MQFEIPSPKKLDLKSIFCCRTSQELDLDHKTISREIEKEKRNILGEFHLSKRTCIFIIAIIGFGLITYNVDWTIPKYIPLNQPEWNPYRLNQLEKDDNETLIDIMNFSYKIRSNQTCKDSFLLILVHSTPQSSARRNDIRMNWGGYENTTVVFVMGYDEHYEEAVAKEASEFGDIVQGDFIESYRNLTYKHVMALKWTTYFCQEALYILKTDDDMIVHTPNLIRYLNNTISPYGAHNLIMCSQKHRFHKGRLYPSKQSQGSYCFGWAIVYSRNVVFDLYRMAQTTFYFWVDDLHITGYLASKLRLYLLPIHKLTIYDKQADLIIGRGNVTAHHIFVDPFLFKSTDLDYLAYGLECSEKRRPDPIRKKGDAYTFRCTT